MFTKHTGELLPGWCANNSAIVQELRLPISGYREWGPETDIHKGITDEFEKGSREAGNLIKNFAMLLGQAKCTLPLQDGA
jgi:hypothetical protein